MVNKKFYLLYFFYYIYKNYWVNHINNNKRKYLALNAKGIYFKKSFGKKFVNYLSPTYYISMLLS